MKMNQVWVFETTIKLMILLSVFGYATSASTNDTAYDTSAANYTVGGSSGWSLDSDVQIWSSSNTFFVGDTLVFLYRPIHNVLEVNELAYNNCVSSNPIGIYDKTWAIITLESTATRYFICGTHCSKGLKVKIIVSASTNPHAPPHPAVPLPKYDFPPSSATNTPHRFVFTSIVISLLSSILMIINS
ncbi:hypothetical protein MKX03_011560 [Papaver bracteatum]|nr:hypothetical protein MKX03_011560 [Papaver bracteatum]